MRIQITDKKKKDMFVSIFHILKNFTSFVSITFSPEMAHIQGMDNSHVSLFDIHLGASWFSEYIIDETTQICYDTSAFYSIMSVKSDNQSISIQINNNDPDTLHIHFDAIDGLTKGEAKKTFKMHLAEYEYEELGIPNVEYDAEFSLSSKQCIQMCSQLSIAGNDVTIKCTETALTLSTTGTGTISEMVLDISVDDVNSYSIVEDECIQLCYSLVHLEKMITAKLSDEIEFSLSNDRPMRIQYNLGDNSNFAFYIAPRVNE